MFPRGQRPDTKPIHQPEKAACAKSLCDKHKASAHQPEMRRLFQRRARPLHSAVQPQLQNATTRAAKAGSMAASAMCFIGAADKREAIGLRHGTKSHRPLQSIVIACFLPFCFGVLQSPRNCSRPSGRYDSWCYGEAQSACISLYKNNSNR